MRSMLAAVCLVLSGCGSAGGSTTRGGTGSGDADGGSNTDTGGDTGSAGSTGAPGCMADEDCPATMTCDPQSGACVCAAGLIACGDMCVAEHAADIEIAVEEVIDTRPDLGSHYDLAVDADDVPLVVYRIGSDDVWLAHRESGTWSLQEVYAPPYDRLDDAAVAAGPGGDIEVAVATFYDGKTTFRSGTSDGATWSFANLMNYDMSSYGTIDLEYDPAGEPRYLATHRFSINGQLEAYLSPDWGWRLIPLDPEMSMSDVAFDPQGRAHIAYDNPGDGLYHQVLEGDEWIETQLETHPINISFVSEQIAVDSSGHARVIYIDPTDQQIRIARQTDTSWQTEVVLAEQPDLRLVFISIDRDDVEHVTYHTVDGSMYYARHDGAAWTHLEVGQGADPRPPLLAVSDPTRAHIVYGADDFDGPLDPELHYVQLAITPLCP